MYQQQPEKVHNTLFYFFLRFIYSAIFLAILWTCIRMVMESKTSNVGLLIFAMLAISIPGMIANFTLYRVFIYPDKIVIKNIFFGPKKTFSKKNCTLTKSKNPFKKTPNLSFEHFDLCFEGHRKKYTFMANSFEYSENRLRRLIYGLNPDEFQ